MLFVFEKEKIWILEKKRGESFKTVYNKGRTEVGTPGVDFIEVGRTAQIVR